jgi:tRNA (guanine37-N1)-methyltransferase
MLIMAQPIIDAVNSIIQKIQNSKQKKNKQNFKIIFPTPSHNIRNQESAHSFSKTDNLIFICGRYE